MKSIAGYNVIKLLAKGGMAAIYLAEQQSLQRQVVLKFLNPKLDDVIKKRFIDEGRIIASLKHPNIITVFDVVSSEKHNFLAMEYLPDGDLETRLQKPLDTFTVLNIISKIADALHLIHKQGIIHGDIKPANILFRENCPLLTDFGISHRIEPKKEVEVGSGELYASPTYASPELIQGKPFDYRTDLYSLGIMMYEMLMGEKPFRGDTEIETIANSIQQPVPQLPDDLHELQPLLDSLLAKSPEDRLSDAKLVTRFIAQYLRDHPTLSKPSDTKLIDTEVVVEYIARKKQAQGEQHRRSFIVPLVILVLLLLAFWFNKDQLWQQFIAEPPQQAAEQPRILTPEARIDLRPVEVEKVVLQTTSSTSQLQAVPAAQVKLQQKEAELARIKQELERQKKKSRQKQLNKNRNIAALLKQGAVALKKYNLTTPLNDNALYYYQKVLELDKNNKDAKQGIKEVAYRYELLARSELDKYHYQKAQAYINSGLTVDADNERLLSLKEEASLSGEPKRVINKVTNFFKNL